MTAYSILNDVLGPVMHGPSSSHTAASHRLGRLARDLLGGRPVQARITFDRRGSYGAVFRQQGSDLALATGLLGWPMTDERFFEALALAPGEGLNLSFHLGEIPEDDHPNAVRLDLAEDGGRRVAVLGRSVGGGSVEITNLDGWPVHLAGQAHDYLVVVEPAVEEQVQAVLSGDGLVLSPPERAERAGRIMLRAARSAPLAEADLARLAGSAGVERVYAAAPVLLVQAGRALADDWPGLLSLCRARGCSLGRAGLAYEAELLGLSQAQALAEMDRRYEMMAQAVDLALHRPERLRPMQLLEPRAHLVWGGLQAGRLPGGGLPARAAVRALAAMEVNSAMGLVCAAPTGGSSGVLPGVLLTLAEAMGLSREQTMLALYAAGAVGLAFLQHGRTFAAEVAGCQVEIGAAGAMAAAAVVEAAGGSAGQAGDAAAIALHNTMGLVCDLVQGAVELPCHTRNAAAAAAAFTCADLILGGYRNPIPLGESVAASLEVGRALRPQYRCTSLGGLAVLPSALGLTQKR